MLIIARVRYFAKPNSTKDIADRETKSKQTFVPQSSMAKTAAFPGRAKVNKFRHDESLLIYNFNFSDVRQPRSVSKRDKQRPNISCLCSWGPLGPPPVLPLRPLFHRQRRQPRLQRAAASMNHRLLAPLQNQIL